MPNQQRLSPRAAAKQRRAVANRYFLGLTLIAVSAVLEQTLQLWNIIVNLGPETSFAEGLRPMIVLLLPFAVGAVLTIHSSVCLQNWGYPFAGRGDLQGLDERQRLEFLQAQAKAQWFYVNLAIYATFWGLVLPVGLEGYSWFFGLQVVTFLTAMFSGLPAALMVRSENDSEDEE